MQHRNIEIKARCDELGRLRDILRLNRARFLGTDRQTDTYFKTNSGRLKLREGNIENYLVYYEREDKKGPKESKVILFKSEPGSSLKEILVKAYGVLVAVQKEREIYFIENVKIHLDSVDGLGTFVEIEAIDADGSIGREKLLAQCDACAGFLGIGESDLVSASYSDLLLARDSGLSMGSDPLGLTPPRALG